MAADRFGNLLHQLPGGVAQAGRPVENRRGEGVGQILQQQLHRFDLDGVVGVVVLTGTGKIVLVGGVLLRAGGDWHIALGFRVADLYIVGQQILREQPGSKYLLRVGFVEYTDRRALADHLWVIGVKLRNHPHGGLKFNNLVGVNVNKRGVGAHPGGAGR